MSNLTTNSRVVYYLVNGFRNLLLLVILVTAIRAIFGWI